MLAVNKFFNNKYNKILLTHFVDNNVANGLYLCTGEFLDMIDSLNTKAYTTGFTSSKGTLLQVVTGLFNGTITANDMLTESHISSVSGIQVRKFGGYVAANKTTTYDDTQGSMKIKYTQPLSVVPGFYRNDTDGTLTSDLYLVFFGSSLCSYLKPIDSSLRQMTSYVAFSITEQGQGGDIELDHTDLIDYLDAYEIQVALPKEIV
jgi:hypothetical protein